MAGLTKENRMVIGCIAFTSLIQEDVLVSDRYPALRLILWSDPQTVELEIVREGNKKARPDFFISGLTSKWAESAPHH